MESEKNMRSALCVGIASKNETYEIVALEHGKESAAMRFPATALGIEAIRSFLNSHSSKVRVAVAGVAALALGLTLGNNPGVETFIVSSNANIANQAAALAHYADHAL